MSEPLATKVSTPLRWNVQIVLRQPFSLPSVMWLITFTRSEVWMGSSSHLTLEFVLSLLRSQKSTHFWEILYLSTAILLKVKGYYLQCLCTKTVPVVHKSTHDKKSNKEAPSPTKSGYYAALIWSNEANTGTLSSTVTSILCPPDNLPGQCYCTEQCNTFMALCSATTSNIHHQMALVNLYT